MPRTVNFNKISKQRYMLSHISVHKLDIFRIDIHFSILNLLKK